MFVHTFYAYVRCFLGTSFADVYKILEFGRAQYMSKILLLSFGLMFSLYGYDYLFDGALSEREQEVHDTIPEKASSFTERISSAKKS